MGTKGKVCLKPEAGASIREQAIGLAKWKRASANQSPRLKGLAEIGILKIYRKGRRAVELDSTRRTPGLARRTLGRLENVEDRIPS